MTLPSLHIRQHIVKFPIIQGGMGIGFSGFKLAGSVSLHGGLGIISSAALDRVTGHRAGIKMGANHKTHNRDTTWQPNSWLRIWYYI